MCEKPELNALQDLLNSWKLPQLMQHFVDEGINIEELEMMKPHHVFEFLRTYKMSVRIRFEHHFDIWRRNINKPLLQHVANQNNYVHHQCCHSAVALQSYGGGGVGGGYSGVHENQMKKYYNSRATNTEETFKINDSSNSPPPMSDMLAYELPKLTPQPRRKTADRLRRNRSPSATPPSLPQSPEVSIMEAPQTIKFHDVVQNGPVTLMQILHSTRGQGGKSLIDYYNKHKEFTVSHRCLLIQLIVNFFVENDYHLSLSTSHNLELQILKNFPTEKLEYYRSEKRGKIYVKFCNLKRYKRMPPKRKSCGSAINNLARDILDADDDYSTSLDFWHDSKLAEVQVKTENLTDDGYT